MASEDVIELGSSDEDSQPPPKKARINKSTPNAMVCIPNKFRDVTIKPTKINPIKIINPMKVNQQKVSLQKVTKGLGKGVTVTKVSNSPHNHLNHIKNNGRQTQHPTAITAVKKVVLKGPLTVDLNKKHTANITNGINMNKPRVVRPQAPIVIKPAIRIQPINPIRLPPTITVKKTAVSIKSPNTINKPMRVKKPVVNRKPREVLTVELDDDDGPPLASASNPKWYLKPEDSVRTTEEKNNKEPEGSKFVEITIEDSPIKPVSTKRTCEIGAELAITIDDSPVKPLPEKNKPANESEDETEVTKKVPQSKKKLQYPIEIDQDKMIEIELEPLVQSEDKQQQSEATEPTTTDINKPEASKDNEADTGKKSKESDSGSKPSTSKEPDVSSKDNEDVVGDVNPEHDEMEIIDSADDANLEESFKQVASKQTSTPKKKRPNDTKKLLPDVSTATEKESEFHPVYQRFIDLCFCLENSEDMKKIVERKIKGYYKQVPKEYTESEEFIDIVSSKILAMKADPEKMYLYIKDIVDELNLQRKLAKSQPVTNSETKSAEPTPYRYGDDSEFDSRRRRQIRKLEKTIKKLHRAIQKLEEQEVDFDDEDDSVYLLTERYKERMVRVYAKFCQLTNTKMPSEPRIQIDARPGQPSGPAKRLEKWINKKVPIGTPLPFPDFHDVLRCVKEANEEDKIGWTEMEMQDEARDLFTRSGKKLQRRRQENEWRTAASRIASEVDPAEKSKDLKKQLDENRQLATKKETEVYNKYADRQNLLKLEAEEIGDKEAEESPVESEDEEANEEEKDPLESTEKRKERLKRLLQENSKKNSEETKATTAKKVAPVVTDENSQENGTDESKNKEDADIKDKAPDEAEVSKEVDKTNEEKLNKDKEISVPPEKQVDDGKNKKETTETHSISDDSNQVESDIDELHLLQKLPSTRDNRSSTIDSSDSGSTIAISDTIDSSGDTKEKPPNDGVISIENSSYSEPDNDEYADKNTALNKSVEKLIHSYMEIDYSTEGVEEVQSKTNNDEYNESVEDILLASSGDEAEATEQERTSVKPENADSCINLSDDLISIDETTINNGSKITADNSSVLEKSSVAESDAVIAHKASGKEKNSANADSSKMTEDNADNADIPNVINKSELDSEVTETIHESVKDTDNDIQMGQQNGPDDDNTDSISKEKAIESDPKNERATNEMELVDEILDSQPESVNDCSPIVEIPDSQPEDSQEEEKVEDQNQIKDDVNDNIINSTENSQDNESSKSPEDDNNIVESEDASQTVPEHENDTEIIESSQDSVKTSNDMQAKETSPGDECEKSVECMDVDDCESTQKDDASVAVA